MVIVIALIYRQKNVRDSLFNSLPNQEQNQEQIPTTTVSPKANIAQKTDYEFVATASSQSALKLVESQVKLDLKQYDFGVMIEGVDGLKADAKHYWALYQNGDYAKVGIADIKLKKGEKLELKYEEIKL